MNRLIVIVASLALMVFSQSCDNLSTVKYTIIYSKDEPVDTITKTLEKVLERNWNVDIVLINNPEAGSLANLDSVAQSKVDFTITENHVPYLDGVQSVLVLYPEVLHVLYHGKAPETFAELVNGRRVFLGEPSSGSYRLAQQLFTFFGIDIIDLELVASLDENPEVAFLMSDLLSEELLLKLADYQLYSFDEVEQFGQGSVADAISLKCPQVNPYIIPEGTYRDLAGGPVFTVSSDKVLVARTSLGDVAVYDMIKTVFKEKQDFTVISPLIFKGLVENFDRGSLTFPIHEGARVYLERDEPGFLERYAELFGVLFSIGIGLVSGAISLSRWRSQKKKDRVDVFYAVVIDIKKKIPRLASVKEGVEYIREIQNAQNKAFGMLINEELAANDSFRIFMELAKETIQELRAKIRTIQSKQT